MYQANHQCDNTQNVAVASASSDRRRLPKTPDDDLLTFLVRLQEASGGFNWGLGFASALGSCSDQKALDAAPFPVEEDTLERQAWLAALAIAIFEDRMPELRPTWELVADKAWRFMVQLLGQARAGLALEAARKFVVVN